MQSLNYTVLQWPVVIAWLLVRYYRKMGLNLQFYWQYQARSF